MLMGRHYSALVVVVGSLVADKCMIVVDVFTRVVVVDVNVITAL